MSFFVEVKESTTSYRVSTPAVDRALLICNVTSTGENTIFESGNPALISSLAEVAEYEITEPTLYSAVYSYFDQGAINSLWIYGVDGIGSYGVSGVLVEGPRDGTSKSTGFTIPYSPLVSIDLVEAWLPSLYANGAVSGKTTASAYWQDQTGYWTAGETYGGIDGTLIFDVTSGFVYSGATATGAGRFPGVGDKIRATITTSNIGVLFNDLTVPEIYFQTFTFAYNQENSNGANYLIGNTGKYGPANCYGGTGWMHDVKLGTTMAKTFNSLGKNAVFIAEVPESVRPNNYMMSGLVSGSVSASGYTFGEIISYLGFPPKTAVFYGKSAYDGIETSAGAMGRLMSLGPRVPITLSDAPGFQNGSPRMDEARGWEAGQINFITPVNGVQKWSTDFTLGSGFPVNSICYHRVLGILMEKIRGYVLGYLGNQKKAKYTLEGINSLQSAIHAAKLEMIGLGYIDGVGTITIPIKTYLLNEETLSEAEAVVLLNARASSVVSDIVVTFIFNGNIRRVTISVGGITGG